MVKMIGRFAGGGQSISWDIWCSTAAAMGSWRHSHLEIIARLKVSGGNSDELTLLTK
ncbi:hypothetical protein KCP69_14740 [Salmonella enterica subsp. enterica]|nr:hypothetical protein KCP69_14740 [Salmonella enterica subsp. enterica]